ncbi:MAG: signal peptide peptidase SppA, partial [Polyangiaceae bacterium]|nr:signal peptide peptidase SppA [Polyangiaceae bacterium]
MPVLFLRTAAALSAASLAANLLASLAIAQPRAQRVPDPGRSVVSSDDSSALVINPANVSSIPGAELRWNWVRTGENAWGSARGHSIGIAGAFPFGLGTGLRVDLVRPPVATPDRVVLLDEGYSWLTWGLGIGGEASALGMSVSHLYSGERGVNGPTTFSFGWTGRPSTWMGLAATANDVNAPKDESGRGLIDRSYSVGAAVRPLGTRALEVGVEARYYSGFDLVWQGDAWPVQDGWVPRATFGIDLPYVGRLRGDVQLHEPGGDDASYVASAVLDLSATHITLTGGVAFGSALGGSKGAGFVVGAAITSWREPGVPEAAQALRIRFEDTPGTREHTALLRSLWKVSEHPEIAAIVLHIKSEPASSLAHADELVDALRLLRARGKKVVCHLEDAGGRALHTCAHAD